MKVAESAAEPEKVKAGGQEREQQPGRKVSIRDVKVVSDAAKFICPVCHEILADAVSCNNGHLFCRPCIAEWLTKKKTCPCDRAALSKTKLSKAPSVFMDMINDLQVECPNHNEAAGCDFVGPFGSLEGHLKECQFATVECLLCKAAVKVADQEKHDDDECPKRLIGCDFCGDEVQADGLEQHLTSTCPEGPDVKITCACGESLLRKDEEKHVEASLARHVVLANKRTSELESSLRLVTSTTFTWGVPAPVDRYVHSEPVFFGGLWLKFRVEPSGKAHLGFYLGSDERPGPVVEARIRFRLLHNPDNVLSHSFRSDGTTTSLISTTIWLKKRRGWKSARMPPVQDGVYVLKIELQLDK